MPEKIVTVEDVKGRALDDLLREVARNHETITVVLEQGQAVEIRSLGALKPLPELKGSIPEGWKEGIYAR
ncbi:MAG: hypothetical protein EXS64_18455 [Candidatus Latescibacteria bacterium]|nr:hypothetical protein [Candidatus Latescibacterota bacterium]